MMRRRVSPREAFDLRGAAAKARSLVHGASWTWGIDTLIPMRTWETQGDGKDRRDCMTKFMAAWDRFAANEANLVEFLNAKRKRR